MRRLYCKQATSLCTTVPTVRVRQQPIEDTDSVKQSRAGQITVMEPAGCGILSNIIYSRNLIGIARFGEFILR